VTSVVAFTPDLMDRSRVAAALPGARFVGALSDLAGAAAEAEEVVVLVDLGRPGATAAGRSLVEAGVRVVGFGSHVDVALLDEARAAGLEVHPRSRALRDLAGVLAAPAAALHRHDDDEQGDMHTDRDTPADHAVPLIPVEHFFENPEHERTKRFLNQILH